MSFPRVLSPALVVSLCLALLASAQPAVAAAAAPAEALYMVSLDVAGSGSVIEPAGRGARGRIAARSERAEQVTERLQAEHGFVARHRYGNAVTGFSARLTPAQARALAEDPKVTDVRPARRARLTGQTVQPGVARVKAVIGGGPAADVDADVAVIDTGIGPSVNSFNGVPAAMGPAGSPELNIAGGVNCYDDPRTRKINEAWEPGNPEVWDGWWADTYGHGTHVAGIIGARDNAVGTVGVAPGVRLWSVRVFGGGFGTEADVVCGLSWVAARNSDADPGNDIEVVNMSLEVDRLNQDENCNVVLKDPQGDPIQQGICQLVGMGVTVVGAAGNARENANRWAPGGYDAVLTVGAMTDTDGEGWGTGGNARCAGYASQGDDEYATGYSNFGRDVDIVAPGTCVRSTTPKANGDATTVMTGTSMAAPHVTGAVARYLADHPGTTPERVRRLVRASGRMDWDAASDPLWSGPADGDLPNRVLDVSALTGGPRLTTWVYHAGLQVAGKATSRTTRVDLQRGGGYGDTVDLAATGLPGGSRATFARRTLTGLGPANLGTNVRFTFGLAGRQGRFDVGVRADGPGVDAHTRNLRLTVDRNGPRISGLRLQLRKVMLTRAGGASVLMTWRATDAVSAVAKTQLQRRKGSSRTWKKIPAGGSSARVQLAPGQANRFRVKAVDSLGNRRWSAAVGARLAVRDSDSGLWRTPAGWKTRKLPEAVGGSILIARGPSSILSTSFRGKGAAIAASVGPRRGKLQVRVDGGEWRTASLTQGRARHRKVVWTTRLPTGVHTIEVRGQSGQVTVDALLFVR